MIKNKVEEPRKVYSNISPENKLIQSIKLYFAARELKKSSVKTFNPNLSDEEIDQKVNEIFKRAGN